MKFARYLQDTQTPEWKKAYIDYRGLKKRITAIRRWQEGLQPLTLSSGDESPGNAGAYTDRSDPTKEDGSEDHDALPTFIHLNSKLNSSAGPSGAFYDSEEEADVEEEADDKMADAESYTQRPTLWRDHSSAVRRSQTLPAPATLHPSGPQHIPGGPLGRRRQSISLSIRSLQPITLQMLLPTLPLIHLAFFAYLDKQLDKIENFYLDREKEAQARSKALNVQLKELKDHRKLYYEAHPNSGLSWSQAFKSNFMSIARSISSPVAAENPDPTAPLAFKERLQVRSTAREAVSKLNKRDSQVTQVEAGSSNGKGKENPDYGAVKGSRRHTNDLRLDPDDYLHAKKKLKRAVLEHYRGLEILNNYRVMNLTGFRKALKKYEKITKVPAQHPYMTEKVEASAFASGDSVNAMRKETEDAFAARFERGDKKRAMNRLRAESQHKSHHLSSFRTGAALGVALPAVICGIYLSFQPQRAGMPWDALMLIYATFAIPVIFALLVGINIVAWSDARINYVFIFELDVRTRLDQREYFEVPAFLLAALSYAFWLSFSNYGSPTLWPLVWLVLVFVVMFNPLPFLFKSSRWWLLRSVGELLISGVHRVEFTDFWMGDQFCSLVFTLSNLYFTVCAYSDGFTPDVWHRCGAQTHRGWSVEFALAIIPFVVRLVQSIRRYADSKLPTHLVNGGKYSTGIVYYLCYFIWRFHGQSNRGAPFIAWCFFGTIYSLYACIWDYLMDWSFFKPHSKYPLLRSDLVYTDEIPLYYFALISNILIRFIWVLYIPLQGPSLTLRTFIGASLEILRRWQWNFYRLENEHIGNMDQYRISREVPLPYAFDPALEEDQDDDEDAVSHRTQRSWLQRRRERSTNLKPIVPNDV